MTAGMGVLDGRTGMNRLMVGPDMEALRDGLTHIEHGQNLRFETEDIGEPLMITNNGFRVKRFANCGAAHRAMDCLLILMEEHGFGAADVERIDVYAPKVHFNNLMYTRPVDGLQSKFSIEYAMAVILATGACTLGDFEDAAVGRPEVRPEMEKIIRCPVDKLEREFATWIEVVMRDGRVLKHEMAMPLGSIAAPFTDAQYWEKYEACVEGVLDGPQNRALKDALRSLRSLDNISGLTEHMKWGLD